MIQALHSAKISVIMDVVYNHTYRVFLSNFDKSVPYYYYRQKKDMKALKVYISAQKVLSGQLTAENEAVIKDRINDLRVRMGKSVVDAVLKEFL